MAALGALCWAAALAAPTRRAALSPTLEPEGDAVVKTRWIHIPKTSSTFANTIYRYGCANIDNVTTVGDTKPIKDLTMPFPPEEYCAGGPMTDIDQLDEHPPWQTPYANGLITTRDPYAQKKSLLEYTMQKARLEWALDDDKASAVSRCEGWYLTLFNNYTHTIMPAEDSLTLRSICTEAIASSSYDLQFPTDKARCPYLDVLLPRVSGCQSKMTVFGEGCLQQPAITSATDRAAIINKTAASLYAFSAMIERYNESICAFHQLMKPQMMTVYDYADGNQPIPAQFVQGRATDVSGGHGRVGMCACGHVGVWAWGMGMHSCCTLRSHRP